MWSYHRWKCRFVQLHKLGGGALSIVRKFVAEIKMDRPSEKGMTDWWTSRKARCDINCI